MTQDHVQTLSYSQYVDLLIYRVMGSNTAVHIFSNCVGSNQSLRVASLVYMCTYNMYVHGRVVY